MKAIISQCQTNSTRMSFRVLNLSSIPQTLKQKKNKKTPCYAGKKWEKYD